MRNLLLGGLAGFLLLSPASAADLHYGWDRPEPPALRFVDDDDDDDDDDGYRRSRRYERIAPRRRYQDYDDDDRPRCWVRRTPYGPERVCR